MKNKKIQTVLEIASLFPPFRIASIATQVAIAAKENFHDTTHKEVKHKTKDFAKDLTGIAIGAIPGGMIAREAFSYLKSKKSKDMLDTEIISSTHTIETSIPSATTDKLDSNLISSVHSNEAILPPGTVNLTEQDKPKKRVYKPRKKTSEIENLEPPIKNEEVSEKISKIRKKTEPASKTKKTTI